MKVLVIGCGSIGRRHAANAAALASTAVYDASAAAARDCAAATGATPFDTLDAALTWRPDAVVVATPHRSHLALATAAIPLADVLIEKPLSHSLEGVGDFLCAVERADRRAFIVCNMRFHPGPAALREALPRVGTPLFARAHVGNYLPSMRPGRDYRELYAARRAEGGGVVLDAVHEIDYLSWLFGPVARVACRAGKLSDLDIDVEDHALLTIASRVVASRPRRSSITCARARAAAARSSAPKACSSGIATARTPSAARCDSSTAARATGKSSSTCIRSRHGTAVSRPDGRIPAGNRAPGTTPLSSAREGARACSKSRLLRCDLRPAMASATGSPCERHAA